MPHDRWRLCVPNFYCIIYSQAQKPTLALGMEEVFLIIYQPGHSGLLSRSRVGWVAVLSMPPGIYEMDIRISMWP